MWTQGDRYGNTVGYSERCWGTHTICSASICLLLVGVDRIILPVLRDELPVIWFSDSGEATWRKPRLNNRYWQKEGNHTIKGSVLLCCEALRHLKKGMREGSFSVPQISSVCLGHMVCFPSHYLSCLKHLHTGNKDSQGNISCKSLRDVNGGLDKGKAGQVIQRLRTAGIVNFVCACVCGSFLQLTKGVDSSRMGMGDQLAHLQSKPRHKLRT